MQELKVGQRIEVYEAVTNGYYGKSIKIGSWRPKVDKLSLNTIQFPSIKRKLKQGLCMIVPEEARLVAVCTITKLKEK